MSGVTSTSTEIAMPALALTARLIVSFAGAVALMAFIAVAVEGARTLTHQINRAIDGDTVEIVTGEDLRLEQIDAPELNAQCAEEAALAWKATERLKTLLPRVVDIEDSGFRGVYGRRLVTLRLDDGRSASDVLVSEGLAVWWAGERHPRSRDWC
ncbi:UNVERIFIED_CONTAM: hypothetical protein BEN50_19100 [Euhalothece sp. KZN 001]